MTNEPQFAQYCKLTTISSWIYWSTVTARHKRVLTFERICIQAEWINEKPVNKRLPLVDWSFWPRQQYIILQLTDIQYEFKVHKNNGRNKQTDGLQEERVLFKLQIVIFTFWTVLNTFRAIFTKFRFSLQYLVLYNKVWYKLETIKKAIGKCVW